MSVRSLILDKGFIRSHTNQKIHIKPLHTSLLSLISMVVCEKLIMCDYLVTLCVFIGHRGVQLHREKQHYPVVVMAARNNKPYKYDPRSKTGSLCTNDLR